jgi:hypothetical protein
MRILGYCDVHKELQIPKFEEPIFMSLPKRSKPSSDKINELQQKVRALERQLEDEKLRSEAYIRVIEKRNRNSKYRSEKSPIPSNPRDEGQLSANRLKRGSVGYLVSRARHFISIFGTYRTLV